MRQATLSANASLNMPTKKKQPQQDQDQKSQPQPQQSQPNKRKQAPPTPATSRTSPRKKQRKSPSSSPSQAPMPLTTPSSSSLSKTSSRLRKFFLLVITHDHIARAVAGNIVQAGHGSLAPLQRMAPGDGIVFYAPRMSLDKNAAVCRRFVAIGSVAPGDVYRVEISATFRPWRRDARYVGGKGEGEVREVAMDEVLGRLECLGCGKGRYGMLLRRGVVEMTAEDWAVVWREMVGREEGEGVNEGEGEEGTGV